MARLERFLRDILATRTDPDQRQILHRYTNWHLLRRLRRRNNGQPATQQQYAVVHQHTRAATILLDWLTGQHLTLATCGQGDLDRWLSGTDASHRHQAGHFVRWAANQRLTTLSFPATRWHGPTRALDDLADGTPPAGHPSPWLFPGGQPGRPISATHLGQRLKDLDIQPGPARSTALFQLATEVPAALLARMLGIHIDVAVAWQHASAGDWMTYAADVARRPGTQAP